MRMNLDGKFDEDPEKKKFNDLLITNNQSGSKLPGLDKKTQGVIEGLKRHQRNKSHFVCDTRGLD
jgi:hypothetical protein